MRQRCAGTKTFRRLRSVAPAVLASGALVNCGGLVAGHVDAADQLADAGASTPTDAVVTTTPRDSSTDDTDLDGRMSQDGGPIDSTVDTVADSGTRVVDAGASTCSSRTHPQTGACLPDDPAAGLPSTVPCLAGRNILWTGGDPDNGIFEGTQTFGMNTWSAGGDYGLPDFSVIVTLDYPSGWWMQFSTRAGDALQTGVVYWPATFTWATNRVGPPNLDVETLGDAGGCQDGEGAFRLDALDVVVNPDGSPNIVNAITVTFWMHCDGHAGIFRACLHYGQ